MSTIENAKKLVNWQHPNRRRGCHLCKHGYQEVDRGGLCSPSWRCGLHGFYTHRHAICDDWSEIKVKRA